MDHRVRWRLVASRRWTGAAVACAIIAGVADARSARRTRRQAGRWALGACLLVGSLGAGATPALAARGPLACQKNHSAGARADLQTVTVDSYSCLQP